MHVFYTKILSTCSFYNVSVAKNNADTIVNYGISGLVKLLVHCLSLDFRQAPSKITQTSNLIIINRDRQSAYPWCTFSKYALHGLMTRATL